MPMCVQSQRTEKTHTIYQRQYRERLKETPELYRKYREKQNQYDKRYRCKKQLQRQDR